MPERLSNCLSGLLLAAIVLVQTTPLAPGSCRCATEGPAPGGRCCPMAVAAPRDASSRPASSRPACCQPGGGRIRLVVQPNDGDATGCGKYDCACRRVELLVLKPAGESLKSARGWTESLAFSSAVVGVSSALSANSAAERRALIRPPSGDQQALLCVWQI